MTKIIRPTCKKILLLLSLILVEGIVFWSLTIVNDPSVLRLGASVSLFLCSIIIFMYLQLVKKHRLVYQLLPLLGVASLLFVIGLNKFGQNQNDIRYMLWAFFIITLGIVISYWQRSRD